MARKEETLWTFQEKQAKYPTFRQEKESAPPPFPENFQIFLPMGKQNHFLGVFEMPKTRAPLFLFLEFNETEHRYTQWERVVKLTNDWCIFRAFRLHFGTFLMIASVLRVLVQMQLSNTLLAFGLTCSDKIFFCQEAYTVTV